MEGPPRPPRSSSSSPSPAPPPQKRRVMGPSLDDDTPPDGPAPPSSSSSGPSPAQPAQRRRVMGPSLHDDDAPLDGPALPPSTSSSSTQPPQRRRVMGPSLHDDDDTPLDGPAPPPSSSSSSAPSTRRVMGPSLHDDETPPDGPAPEGPALPPGFKREAPKELPPPPPTQGRKRELERGPSIGPTIGPPRPSEAINYTEEDEEEEERRMRADEWAAVKNADTTKVIHREEWMTELPPERSANPTALITNRQFSRKDNVTGRGDSSLWTDSPADKARKKTKVQETKNMKEIATQHFDTQKDETNAKIIEQYNKKFRAKTLAEEHQENLKKKQAEAKPEDMPLWKPFDRTDLEQRSANPKTAAKLIKESQNLNLRFGSASNKRFL